MYTVTYQSHRDYLYPVTYQLHRLYVHSHITVTQGLYVPGLIPVTQGLYVHSCISVTHTICTLSHMDYVPSHITVTQGLCTWSLGMRRYGDTAIQYRYGGSRYVSWPSAIYRDTTLTFCYRGKSPRCLYFLYLTSFPYSFTRYNLCGHCVKCLLKWIFNP